MVVLLWGVFAIKEDIIVITMVTVSTPFPFPLESQERSSAVAVIIFRLLRSWLRKNPQPTRVQSYDHVSWASDRAATLLEGRSSTRGRVLCRLRCWTGYSISQRIGWEGIDSIELVG